VSLAGFSASDSIWREFDAGWKEILKGNGKRPEIKFFHTVDAVNENQPFDRASGWKSNFTEQIIIEFLHHMQKFDKKRFRSFACTVDLEGHRRVAAKRPHLKTPLEICTTFCPEAVLWWITTKYPDPMPHSVHYFFDLTEPFQDSFAQRWKNKKSVISPDGSDYLWGMIKSVTDADMRGHPALQAADLMAWASSRIITHEQKPDRFRNILEFVRAIVPSTWSVWGEAELLTGKQRKNP
jgi:hypothetical protein